MANTKDKKERQEEALEAELVDDEQQTSHPTGETPASDEQEAAEDPVIEAEVVEEEAGYGEPGHGEEATTGGASPKEAQLAQQLIEEHNRLTLLQADFQNYKRRTEEEKEKTVKFANEKLILSLLNVMDNFERALEATDEKDAFYEGVAMIQDQLKKVLEEAGLEEIEATGKPFDHDTCDCVAMVEEGDYEPGIVVDTLRKGYRLNDKVIRPAMVRVAK